MSNTPQDIRSAAMRWLVRREYSQHELTERLCQRGFGRVQVGEVVEAMVEEDLVCDHRFTDALIHARTRRGYGPLKISALLRERGVASTLIEAAVDMSAPQWIESGRQVWQRRFPELPQNYKEWARQARFMVQRGFTHEQARAIVGDAVND